MSVQIRMIKGTDKGRELYVTHTKALELVKQKLAIEVSTKKNKI